MSPDLTESPTGGQQGVAAPHAVRDRLLASQWRVSLYVMSGGLAAGGLLMALVLRRDLGLFSMTGAVSLLLFVLGLAGARLAYGADRIARSLRGAP